MESTKIPLFRKLFCVLSLWYVSGHTLQVRDRYGIYYGTKRMEYSIERERSKRREKKTYHTKNKSISTAKTYRWYRTVFNWNNVLLICFIGFFVPSCILILLVCMIQMIIYMFSPLSIQRLVPLRSKPVLHTMRLVLLFNVCCCVLKINPYFCNRTLNCCVVYIWYATPTISSL